MRGVAALLLSLTLAACSRQDPAAGREPVAGAAQPAQPPPASPVTSTADPGTPPTAAAAAASPAPPAPAGAITPAPDGAALFASTCATCHMADGSGVPFLQPSIKGSAWISSPDPQLLLTLILRGSAVLGEAAKAYDNDMAPQEHLTDAEIAAVATYVRSRFAAPSVGQPVTPAEVAIARARPGLPE